MSEGYHIQRISFDRLKDLIPLYADAFNKMAKLEYFQNKFATKVFGAEYIGYIAYAENETPAAYYGLFPCLAELDGRTILSATSGDTMTHSAHRGKGLFMQLAERTYALAKESGIKFAFGFPNQDSLKGSIKLGWEYKGEHLRFFSVKVNTLPFAKLAKKLNLQNRKTSLGVYFPNSLREDGGAVIHNNDFFAYKSYSPKYVEEIGGSRVWMKVDGALKVGDVERNAAFDAEKFLEELKRYAFKRGITEIQFMVSNDTWLEKKLSAILPGMDAFPVGHFHFDTAGLDLSKMKYGMGDLDTF